MRQDAEFYRMRIAEADRDVAAATLSNVRERAERARRRWVELSEKSKKAADEREKYRRERGASQ